MGGLAGDSVDCRLYEWVWVMVSRCGVTLGMVMVRVAGWWVAMVAMGDECDT